MGMLVHRFLRMAGSIQSPTVCGEDGELRALH